LRSQSALLSNALASVESQLYTVAEQASPDLASAIGELERRMLALRAAVEGLRPAPAARFDGLGE